MATFLDKLISKKGKTRESLDEGRRKGKHRGGLRSRSPKAVASSRGSSEHAAALRGSPETDQMLLGCRLSSPQANLRKTSESSQRGLCSYENVASPTYRIEAGSREGTRLVVTCMMWHNGGLCVYHVAVQGRFRELFLVRGFGTVYYDACGVIFIYIHHIA